MEVSASAKRLRISAQKARLVADQVRGKPVAEALDILNFSTKKGAVLVRKVVESATKDSIYLIYGKDTRNFMDD